MRAAGAVTVMVCSILAGVYLSVCERRAHSALSELCGLFSYLRECVCERLMPTEWITGHRLCEAAVFSMGFIGSCSS